MLGEVGVAVEWNTEVTPRTVRWVSSSNGSMFWVSVQRLRDGSKPWPRWDFVSGKEDNRVLAEAGMGTAEALQASERAWLRQGRNTNGVMGWAVVRLEHKPRLDKAFPWVRGLPGSERQ